MIDPPERPSGGSLRHYDPLAGRSSRRAAAARKREHLDPGNPEVEHADGWLAFSYLVAGMIVYGLVGWLIGHFTHLAVLFPIGLAMGLAVGILRVVLKYGRG